MKIKTGKQLREFRQKRGLNYESMAKELGCSPYDVWNAEKSPNRRLKKSLLEKAKRMEKEYSLLFLIFNWRKQK